ncbi:multicopper oxidase domain-containing protein [Nocardia uniformis]|uniref:Multicopper oxidase domain-containing protein n=2 Tax=Nocardia uniformis TaxID=53432 RepID=A0A849C480_9NOCA|nr:multicopper oxidase domain-containing protein [Nocardia uniformis]
MAAHEVHLDGQVLTLDAYNGSTPGQVLRVRPGDTMRVLLRNMMRPTGIPLNSMPPLCSSKPGQHHHDHDLADCVSPAAEMMMHGHTGPQMMLATNLHTHGLQVSPEGNADNVFVRVDPLGQFQYEYHIPHDQPAGMAWYHPHFHGSTSHAAWNGLAGPLIIEGDVDAVPEIAEMRERVLVVNELWVGDDTGEVPTARVVPIGGPVPFSSIPAVASSMMFPVNGQLVPEIDIRPGETQRWRLLNACPHRALWLHVDGHDLHQIGQDGVPFAAPERVPNLMLSAGNRVEFIVQAGEPGRYRVYAERYDQGHPGGPRPRVHLATLVVAGTRTSGRIPATLVEPPRMPDLPIARRRTLTFSGDISGRTGSGVVFRIDNQEYDLDRIDQEVEAGTVEEWTIVNDDVFQHPFHIHVNPFQIVDVQGIPADDTSWGAPDPTVWWDVFRVPPKGQFTLRTYFRPDVVGKTVYHCHILPHEDNGMMGNILIRPAGAQ